ncbi:MAG: hypothetical protein V8R08_07235 [Coriobacteriales bacterium]
MSSFQETARELLDKGAGFVSGLASTAGDAASKAKIKMKIADLSLEEGKLMQQLGRDVYDQFGDDAAFRESHAELIGRIEETVAHRRAYEDELTAMSATVEDAWTLDEPQPIDVDAIIVNDEAIESEKYSKEKDAE